MSKIFRNFKEWWDAVGRWQHDAVPEDPYTLAQKAWDMATELSNPDWRSVTELPKETETVLGWNGQYISQVDFINHSVYGEFWFDPFGNPFNLRKWKPLPGVKKHDDN